MRKSLVVVGALLLAAAPLWAGWEEGVSAFTQKNYSQAEKEFQGLVDQNPEGYRGHYMLGLTLEQLGRKEEALHHLRKAYDLNPNDLMIKLALGRAYINVRRYKDGATLLGTVGDTEVNGLAGAQKAAFYQLRGESRSKTSDNSGALADFKKLSRLRPDQSDVQLRFGVEALKWGDLDEAVSALAQAYRLAPADEDAARTYVNALIRQGRTTADKNLKKQHYLKAAEVAKKLSAGKPTFENLLLQCSVELGAGQFEDAIVTGKAAIAKNGKDWLPYFYVGQANSSAKKYAEAEAPLQQARALATKPADVRTVWIQLGLVFEKQRKFSDSIAAYQNAGDSQSVERVKENERTNLENQQIESENERIRKMEEEAAELERKLKEIEQGGGGGRR